MARVKKEIARINDPVYEVAYDLFRHNYGSTSELERVKDPMKEILSTFRANPKFFFTRAGKLSLEQLTAKKDSVLEAYSKALTDMYADSGTEQ
jgi:hypothetical protein